MIALFNLFNRYYWKSFFGPFFTFLFPIMLFGTFGLLNPNPSTTIPGLLSMMSIGAGLNGIPTVLVDFRKSVLMRRIGTTPIRKWHFSFVLISYFFVMNILAMLWSFLWILILFSAKESSNDALGIVGGARKYEGIFGSISWGQFVFAQIMSFALAMSMGFSIGILSNSAAMAGVLGGIIGFLANFLSGQLLPIDQINQYDGLRALSYVTPFRFTTGLTVSSFLDDGKVAFVNGAPAIYENAGVFNFNSSQVSYAVVSVRPTSGFTPEWFDSLQTEITPVSGESLNEYEVFAYKRVQTLYYSADKWLNVLLPSILVVALTSFSTFNFKWNKR